LPTPQSQTAASLADAKTSEFHPAQKRVDLDARDREAGPGEAAKKAKNIMLAGGKTGDERPCNLKQAKIQFSMRI
jgi:hypothetical protein